MDRISDELEPERSAPRHPRRRMRHRWSALALLATLLVGAAAVPATASAQEGPGADTSGADTAQPGTGQPGVEVELDGRTVAAGRAKATVTQDAKAASCDVIGFFTEECGRAEITTTLLYNGLVDWPSDPWKKGDVVSFVVEVKPKGGHDDLWLPTYLDMIHGGGISPYFGFTLEYPTDTSVISAPTRALMSRTDNGDRGQGPAVNCAFQKNQKPPSNLPPTWVGLDAASPTPALKSSPIFKTYDPGGPFSPFPSYPTPRLWAAWNDPGYDRCVGSYSRNGVFGGFSVRFDQTIVGAPATKSTLTWAASPLQMFATVNPLKITTEPDKLIQWGQKSGFTTDIAARANAPTIGATTPTVGGAKVMWSPSVPVPDNEITGYRVWRYKNGSFDGFNGFSDVPPNTVGLSPWGLTPGVPYTFRVQALARLGPSDLSAFSSPVVPIAEDTGTVPGAPTNVRARPGQQSVTLTWDPPADDGGNQIQGYEATACIVGGACEDTTFETEPDGTTVVYPGLEDGVNYTFVLRAVNAKGVGAASAESEWTRPGAVVMECTTPTVPGTQGEAANMTAVAPLSVPRGTQFQLRISPGTIPVRPSAYGYPIVDFKDLEVVYPIPAGTTLVSTNLAGGSNLGPGTPSVVVEDGKIKMRAPGPIAAGVTGVWPTLVATLEATGAEGDTIRARLGGTSTADPGYSLWVTAFSTQKTSCYGTTNPWLSETLITAEPWGPGFEKPSEFATKQIEDFADRPATTSELNAWQQSIEKRTKTPAQLTDDLRTDAQWEPIIGPVVRLYSAYFLRNPDNSGLQYWIAQRRAGRSLASISSAFANSNEFKTRYGSLSNLAFVNLVYQNVLGRPGEDDGVKYWTGQLNSKARNRGEVMVGFSESGEYRRRSADKVVVITAFLGMLRRTPTTAELTSYTGQLAAGLQPYEVIDQILALPEYLNRV